MNLAKHDQWPGSAFAGGAELLQKFLPIPFDRGPGVLLGESKIQGATPVDFGESAGTSTEAVNDPGNGLEGISLQDFELSFSGSLQGHQNILAMSVTSWAHRHPTNNDFNER